MRVMKNLKISLVTTFVNNPIRFRFGLVLLGVTSGFLHPIFGKPVTTTFTELKAALLLGFSVLVYAFLLTLYRIMQQLFSRRALVAYQDFDERVLVKTAGLFWFIPFGLTLHILAYFNYADDASVGTVFIIQGLSLLLGTWLSRMIKK